MTVRVLDQSKYQLISAKPSTLVWQKLQWRYIPLAMVVVLFLTYWRFPVNHAALFFAAVAVLNVYAWLWAWKTFKA